MDGRMGAGESKIGSNMSLHDNVFLAKRAMVDSIYRSARLEGIAATFADTESILENRGCANLKPNDVTAIINLKRGWEFILDEEILSSRQVDIGFLRQVHEILARGLDTVQWFELGRLRTDPVYISGTNWRPEIPDAELCHEELKSLLGGPNALDVGLELYLWICRRQMFKDGNKRVANIASNFWLVQHCLGVLSIPDNLIIEFKELLVKYYESGDSVEAKRFLRKYCYLYDQNGLPEVIR